LEIIVVIQVQMLCDGPITELIKQNLSTTIAINLIKLSNWIVKFTYPLFNHQLGSQEFLQVDSAVTSCVDSPEGLPVFKSLSQGHEEDSEFRFLNVVVGVFVTLFPWYCILSELECSHNSWSSLEKSIVLNDITKSLLALSKRTVSVSVVIKSSPQLCSSFNLSWIGFAYWKASSNCFPIDSSALLSSRRFRSWHSGSTTNISSHH